MAIKQKIIDFSDVSGGTRLSVSDNLVLKDDQVADGTINAQLLPGGPIRAPGHFGIKSTAVFTGQLTGLNQYLQKDGTDKMIGLAGGKLYDVDKLTGGTTERYDLTGTGEGVGETFRDKFWITNGTAAVKLENETAYLMGIQAPVSTSGSSAQAGGSLADGVYKIYWGYVRKVGGSKVLFSKGIEEADVTLGSGNNTVRVPVTASTDPQVTNIAIWMTDADGTIYYYYKDAANTTGNVDIADTTDRDTTLIYSVDALPNNTPADLGGFEYLAFHNNRLWGANGDTAYYSLEAGTVYQLERFPTDNFFTYPFKIDGIFSIGEHVYFNTVNGLIRQPYGDPTAEFEWVTERFYFLYPKTVVPFKGGVVGLTNHGVRFFDGMSYSDDWSDNIDPEIEKMRNAPVGHTPCGAIYQRDKRTEYHLTYADPEVTESISNRTWVLDLSRAFSQNPVLAWEKWGIGAEFMFVDNSNVFYHGQSIAGSGTIYNEKTDFSYEINIYGELGNFITAPRFREFKIVTRKVMPSAFGRTWFNQVRGLVQVTQNLNVDAIIADRRGFSSNSELGDIDGETVSRFGISRFGIARFTAANVDIDWDNLPMNMKGYTIYLEATQTADDVNMKMLMLALKATIMESDFN